MHDEKKYKYMPVWGTTCLGEALYLADISQDNTTIPPGLTSHQDCTIGGFGGGSLCTYSLLASETVAVVASLSRLKLRIAYENEAE